MDSASNDPLEFARLDVDIEKNLSIEYRVSQSLKS